MSARFVERVGVIVDDARPALPMKWHLHSIGCTVVAPRRFIVSSILNGHMEFSHENAHCLRRDFEHVSVYTCVAVRSVIRVICHKSMYAR